jgi:hypothetical protein
LDTDAAAVDVGVLVTDRPHAGGNARVVDVVACHLARDPGADECLFGVFESVARFGYSFFEKTLK